MLIDLSVNAVTIPPISRRRMETNQNIKKPGQRASAMNKRITHNKQISFNGRGELYELENW